MSLRIKNPYPIASRIHVDEEDLAPSSHICRRRISRENGQALEVLGHAIEYLMDEHRREHPGTLMDEGSPTMQAVRLLMASNRRIWFECPVIPTWGERLRTKLRIHGI